MKTRHVFQTKVGQLWRGWASVALEGVHSLVSLGIVCLRMKGLSKASLQLGGSVDYC